VRFETQQGMIRTGASFVRIVAYFGRFYQLAVDGKNCGVEIEQKARARFGQIEYF
jgi:hypothetical protein